MKTVKWIYKLSSIINLDEEVCLQVQIIARLQMLLLVHLGGKH